MSEELTQKKIKRRMAQLEEWLSQQEAMLPGKGEKTGILMLLIAKDLRAGQKIKEQKNSRIK